MNRYAVGIDATGINNIDVVECDTVLQVLDIVRSRYGTRFRITFIFSEPIVDCVKSVSKSVSSDDDPFRPLWPSWDK